MSLPVTEDTPPDMLAGYMDLKVILPDGKTVKMSVQRGTPMMDLLVQATTAHCLSPGDYSLQAMGDRGVLPFKPSTPIGALDTFTVKIVEKKLHSRGRAPQVPQNFLNTFRLQVHLPRSQLFVLRVTPEVTLSEIMTHICTEKNLNMDKYEFRNTGNLEEVLELNKTLGDYKLQELSMVSKSNKTVTGLMSSADIINVKSSKHRQNSICDSSLSSGSFGSRSGSPVAAINVVTMPPQPPIRKKRRPAPKPPSFAAENEKKDQTTGSVLISHSRESSDSSGYHEASVLSESPTHGGPAGRIDSDSPPDTLPRRSKLPPSQSFTNLTSIQPAPRGRLTNSISNTSLNSNGHSRKKRAPPPPPTQAFRDDKIKSSTLPISVAEERKNGSSGFTTEDTLRHSKVEACVDVSSNAKVQIPVEVTTTLVNETKASKDEVVPASIGKTPKTRDVVATSYRDPNAACCTCNDVDSFHWETLVRESPQFHRPVPTAKPLGNQIGRASQVQDVIVIADTKNDVNVRVPPKPKPRTVLPPNSEATLQKSSKLGLSDGNESEGRGLTRLNRWNNVENLTEGITSEESSRGRANSLAEEEKSLDCTVEDGSVGHSATKAEGVFVNNADTVRNSCLVGDSETHEEPPPGESEDQTDRDSINWEYQLPPPPTDFRDTNSPNITELGTITITPEILENVDGCKVIESEERSSKTKKSEEVNSQVKNSTKARVMRDSKVVRGDGGGGEESHIHHRCQNDGWDKKICQSKSEVMTELTNILNENRKCKEKSLSVSNLYIKDTKDLKKNALNYSRSFSTEPLSSLNNFKITTYQTDDLGNNRKFSGSDEFVCDSDITYRNYKNLEKSSSMECIQTSNGVVDAHSKIIERTNEDVFRKPVAPVQKKLKVAKRSASSIGANTSNPLKRNTLEVTQNSDSWLDDPNISVLRQQFLEFLKEKKLKNNDLNMKSLDVIRNILPELNLDKDANTDSHSHVPVKGNSSQDSAQTESGTEGSQTGGEKVKIVDIKVKSSVPAATAMTPEETNEVVTLRRDVQNGVEGVKREGFVKSPQEKKQEVTKRYSYQGPPSINFATWGERPKTTRIIIKDEDYVTQEKVTEKKSDLARSAVSKNAGDAAISQKGKEVKEVKKPAQIIIKKPGVLSHYEMFSALPRRREVSSLELVHLEDEERKKMGRSESRESSRVPVVCSVELKKEVKTVTCNKPNQGSGVTMAQEGSNKGNNHSVSVYVNGNQESFEKEKIHSSKQSSYNYVMPKRNSLMPVVKGFRPLEENISTSHVNISNSCTTGNHINININSKPETGPKEVDVASNRTSFSTSKRQANGAIPPPPMPPNISFIKLKPVSSVPAKQKVISQDPRGQLLEEIRNFGGLRKLKKSMVY